MTISNCVVVDIETTGLSKFYHQIIEIGAVKLKEGKVSEEFHSLVNPGVKIPSFITRLTGINNEMVKDAPALDTVLHEFIGFLGDDIMVAHCATFDYGFLDFSCRKHLGKGLENKRLCTRRLANRLALPVPNKKLGTLCSHFGIRNEDEHRALGDVKATAQLFLCMSELLKSQEIMTVEEMHDFVERRKVLVRR